MCKQKTEEEEKLSNDIRDICSRRCKLKEENHTHESLENNKIENNLKKFMTLPSEFSCLVDISIQR